MVKNPPVNSGDAGGLGSIPGSERPSGGGNGNPRQYFCLDNPMDKEAWGLQSMGSQRVTRLCMHARSLGLINMELNLTYIH